MMDEKTLYFLYVLIQRGKLNQKRADQHAKVAEYQEAANALRENETRLSDLSVAHFLWANEDESPAAFVERVIREYMAKPIGFRERKPE